MIGLILQLTRMDDLLNRHAGKNEIFQHISREFLKISKIAKFV